MSKRMLVHQYSNINDRYTMCGEKALRRSCTIIVGKVTCERCIESARSQWLLRAVKRGE